jgi:hypothetical protein
MKRFAWLALVPLALVVTIWLGGQVTAMAQDKPAAKAEHGYLGVQDCKMCHSAEAKGAQYTKWEASPHAQAYKTLLTEPAKKICADKGIKEAPEKAAQCLKCHVTAYGAKAALLGPKYTVEAGVGCESCHGPAADWKALHSKDIAAATAAGLVVKADEKVCLTCHNEESPTFKPFKYEERLAKIAHPIPKKAAK